jgi:hypothetical protein
MPRIDYSKTVIYKIYCKYKHIDFLYINSTTDFVKRKYNHKRDLYLNPQYLLSSTINDNGGWNNWNIEIIEEYSCNSRKEANDREQYWYNNFSKLNEHKISTISNCIYCKKHFSRKDNLKRHVEICKSKQVIEEYPVNNQLVVANTTPNLLTTCPTNVLTNTNNSTNNSNNTNNTIINNITNPVTIIPLGQENLVEFFSDEEQVRILKKMFSCFIYLIEYVHFSGKFPQFANMRITNLRSNTAYLYDEGDKKFVAHDQSEVIAEVIAERLNDISNFFENVKDKLNEKEVIKITALINELEEQRLKYTEYQRKLKFMLYNKRHMVNVQES